MCVGDNRVLIVRTGFLSCANAVRVKQLAVIVLTKNFKRKAVIICMEPLNVKYDERELYILIFSEIILSYYQAIHC